MALSICRIFQNSLKDGGILCTVTHQPQPSSSVPKIWYRIRTRKPLQHRQDHLSKAETQWSCSRLVTYSRIGHDSGCREGQFKGIQYAVEIGVICIDKQHQNITTLGTNKYENLSMSLKTNYTKGTNQSSLIFILGHQ
ncbi:hypothetical protein A6R68_07257, partial [Neotoma lepida]